jgi:CRP-like cAMP-binding protein
MPIQQVTEVEMSEDRTNELPEELLAWTKMAHLPTARAAIDQVASDGKHLAALEATDGQRTQGEVATIAGLSQQTVSRLWTTWRRQGLVVEREGKARHLMRPSDQGFVSSTAPESALESH